MATRRSNVPPQRVGRDASQAGCLTDLKRIPYVFVFTPTPSDERPHQVSPAKEIIPRPGCPPHRRQPVRLDGEDSFGAKFSLRVQER
jgi:hypothetical protein